MEGGVRLDPHSLRCFAPLTTPHQKFLGTPFHSYLTNILFLWIDRIWMFFDNSIIPRTQLYCVVVYFLLECVCVSVSVCVCVCVCLLDNLDSFVRTSFIFGRMIYTRKRISPISIQKYLWKIDGVMALIAYFCYIFSVNLAKTRCGHILRVKDLKSF